MALNGIYEIEEDVFYKDANPIVKAIKILEYTGSGLTEKEMKYVNQIIEDAEKYDFKLSVDRNLGITSISEREIEATRRLEEARVQIDIVRNKIDFGAISIIDYAYEEYIEDPDEGYNYVIPYDDLAVLPYPFDISFEEFEDFAARLYRLMNEGIYQFRDISGLVFDCIL